MSGYRRSFPKGTSERMCALMSEARNISELKRAQCIYFRSEHGLPPQQIADMVGFDVGTVRNLHSAFLRDGEAALKLSGKGGRYHAYLTEEEEASWLEGFRDAGENGGILEVGRIQAAFEEKVGRKVAKSTVYDLLHRHGWRKITPRPRHPKSIRMPPPPLKKLPRHRSRSQGGGGRQGAATTGYVPGRSPLRTHQRPQAMLVAEKDAAHGRQTDHPGIHLCLWRRQSSRRRRRLLDPPS